METIINAKIDDSDNLYKIIFNKKIISVIKQNNLIENLDLKDIDLKGSILIPGAIDPHLHFNDPGFTDNEDFFTGTKAALFGGVTTIIDMPCTSLPPVTNVKNFNNKLSIVKDKALVDFAFWGGVNGAEELDLEKLKKLKKRGAKAFKIYTISGMESYKSLSYKKIGQLFKLTKDEDFIFAFHAEDLDTIEKNRKKISKEELKTIDGYLKIRDIDAEVIAIKNIINIAKKYDTKIHIVHLSSKKGLELIKNYKNCTTETAPHYLHFNSNDLYHLKGRLKTAPVVKNREDQLSLIEGIVNGDIDFIATDHAGTIFEKNKQFDDFSKVYNGIPGVETMLPSTFDLYNRGIISLKRLIEITSTNAAKLYNLYPNKGSLEIGTDADFTIMKKESYIFDESMMQSKGKYSPFNNMKFNYKVDKTILRGKIIFNNGKFLGKKGYGNIL